MSSSTIPLTNISPVQQKLQHASLGILCKSIAVCGLVLFSFYTFLYNNTYNYSSDLLMSFVDHKSAVTSLDNTSSLTNISHIIFVLAGSVQTWRYRRPYVEAWWRENITRGNIWLDVPPTDDLLPWPSTSPPFRVNEDITKLKTYSKFVDPIQVRMYRSILDTFRLGDNKDVRWYVMGDDDTLIFVDNLVEVLGKYDHSKYHYIGTNSECIKSNHDFSFEMGFGGAGYALSYSMVKALVSKMDDCIERYQHLRVSDYLSSSCLADMGVDLTIERGLHQIDLRGDISGLLSAHPRSPLLSLHHFDTVEPIFPSKDRSQSINHLMKAAKFDQSRLLQQTICYHRQSNWTFSLSWGYSAHVYETVFPRSILRRPLETFAPWARVRPPLFMFNTRWPWPNSDPCEAPHVFFLETIDDLKSSEEGHDHRVVSVYTRSSSRNLTACSLNGNHSADLISRIQVSSPAVGRKETGRIECCDVEYESGKEVASVKLRACMKGDVLA